MIPRRLIAVSVGLAVLGIAAPAVAAPQLTKRCKSRYMDMAGWKGSGSSFEVSTRPTEAGRKLDADEHTYDYWRDMWNCVDGGFRGARLSGSQGKSLYQQLWCHIQYDINGWFGGETWDLEARRPPIDWRYMTPRHAIRHTCNWEDGDGSPSS
jgi:Protein of unknown function (DUF2599)